MADRVRAALGRLYDRLPFKQPLLSLLRPLHLPPSLYQHLHFTGEFEVRGAGRPFRIVHHGYLIENELYWEGLPGRRERVSMQLWMRLAERAQVVLDIGANTGVYSLVAKAMNPAARVWGFEPVPRVFEKYARNCRLNGFDICAEPIALSNRDGTATLYAPPGEHPVTATLSPDGSGSEERQPSTVPVRSLRSFLEERGIARVDLVKIDVEGHEPEVLEGMGPLLAALRPTLLLEVLTDEAGRRIEALVGPCGYLYFDLDEVGAPRRVPHVSRSSHWNYLLCQEHVAEELALTP